MTRKQKNKFRNFNNEKLDMKEVSAKMIKKAKLSKLMDQRNCVFECKIHFFKNITLIFCMNTENKPYWTDMIVQFFPSIKLV